MRPSSRFARRYLSLDEVAGALARGKDVECFLGQCSQNSVLGIRWFSLSLFNKKVRIAVFESEDLGGAEWLDVYRFGPLDPELELGDCSAELVFDCFDEAMHRIEEKFPGATLKLVNEGVVQDEYADFIASGRLDA